MDVTLTIPEEKVTQLSIWWFAVRWSRFALEDKVKAYQRAGQPCAYDEACLLTLTEVEKFLETTWEDYMDTLQEKLQAAKAKLDQVPTNV
jgi:exonuclease VII small subunit